MAYEEDLLTTTVENLSATVLDLWKRVSLLEALSQAHREIIATMLARLRADNGLEAWQAAQKALEERARLAEAGGWTNEHWAPPIVAEEIRALAADDVRVRRT